MVRSVTEITNSEQDLRKERDFLNAILDVSGALIIVLDKRGKITRFNRACENLTGYSEKEVLGRSVLFLIPDEDAESVRQNFNSLTQGDFPNKHENIWVAKDGSKYLIAWSNMVILGKDGKIEYIIGTGLDITASKRIEKDLRESLEANKAILDSSSQTIFLMDTQGVILSFNKITADWLGRDPSELPGRNMFEFLLPEVAVTRKKIMEEVISTGKMVRFEDQREGRWFDSTVYPIFDDRGQVSRYVVFSNDITERKRAENDLIIAKENLAAELAGISKLQEISTRFVQQKDLNSLLNEIVGAAIDITHADMGSIQLLINSELKIVASRGFDQDILDYFNTVPKSQAACGTALVKGERVIIEDVTKSPIFSGEVMEKILAAGIRSVQSTPLIGRAGQILGMFCTQYRANRVPSERDLNLLDMLARQAADLIERMQAEETLRDREKKFHQIADSIPHLVWTAGPDSMVDYVNSFYKEYFGLDPEKVREMFSSIHPEDLKRCKEAWIHSIKTGEIYEVENRARRHDGEYRWFLTRGIPVKGEDGKIIRWYGSATDIHDLRELQQQLEMKVKERTSELRIASLYARRLIEASIDPLVTISSEGKIMDVNRASETATGVTREQLIGSDFSDYFTDPEKARAGYEEVFRKGVVRDYPLELKHRDGRTTPVLYNATLYRDENGRITGVFAAARDITRRKQAEEALKQSEEAYRLLVELNPIGVFRYIYNPVTGENKRLHCNEAQLRILGYASKEEYLNGIPEEVLSKEDWNTFIKYLLTDGKAVNYPARMKRKDGGVIWVLLNANARPHNGSFLVEGAMTDITAQKKTEERLRRAQKNLRAMAAEIVMADERSRQRFATDLHDTVVQTMGAAKLRSQLIQDKIPQDVMPFYSEMQDFVSQSITQARMIMAEMSPPVLYELGFAPALEWLAEQIAGQHDIFVDFRTNEIPPLIHEIQVLLFQSTRELLMNVVKHAKSKTAVVKATANGSIVKIEIRDQGKGFDTKQAFRTDVSYGGFGLFSIRERLKHFGGQLHIWSKPGRGTKVTITVPRLLDGDS